jgi:hypothetical protein
VPFDEGDEVLRRIAGEGGAGEVRVLGEVVFGSGVEVGEVGAAAAGDKDLGARFVGVVQDEGATAAFAGCDGSHEARGPCAEDEDVVSAGRGHCFDCSLGCVRAWKDGDEG